MFHNIDVNCLRIIRYKNNIDYCTFINKKLKNTLKKSIHSYMTYLIYCFVVTFLRYCGSPSN